MNAPDESHKKFYSAKILLADSDTTMRSLLGELLSKLRFEVFSAQTGHEALGIARKERPDLIILEINLPEIDGLEVCKQLKADASTRDILFLFLTAKDDMDTKVLAFQVGADDFLTKPYSPRELEARIISTLRKKLPEVSTPSNMTVIAKMNEEYPDVKTVREAIENILDVPSPTIPTATDPFRLIGTVLNRKYQLTEFAGAGGMGAVYRAITLTNGEIVAVKFLQPHIVAKSTEYTKLFVREVSNAKGLDHPHIVKIFDSGKDELISYMVMEWIEGHSLEDVITQGKLSLDRIKKIFGQVCYAVAYAHQRNIIHLDIKPGNILLIKDAVSDDFVKVIDFGLSRVITKESGTTVTKYRGTHVYSAPEQFGGKVSHKSDIYSLGVSLYYLLTGVIPFGISYINAKLHPNLELPNIPSVKRLRDVPPEVDLVINKALDKNPHMRQDSATQLFEEFIGALNGTWVNILDDTPRYLPPIVIDDTPRYLPPLISSTEWKPIVQALEPSDINRREEIRKARQLARQLPKSEVRFLACLLCGVIGGGLPLAFFLFSSGVALLCYILIMATSYTLVFKYRRSEDWDFYRIYIAVFSFMIIGIIPISVCLLALWWLIGIYINEFVIMSLTGAIGISWGIYMTKSPISDRSDYSDLYLGAKDEYFSQHPYDEDN